MQNAVGSANTLVGIAINDDAVTGQTSAGGYLESNDVKVVYVGLGGSSQPGIISMPWSTYKAFGPSPLANSNIQGTATTDPVLQQQFNIFAQAVDGTSSIALDVLATLEYTVLWYELKDLVTS